MVVHCSAAASGQTGPWLLFSGRCLGASGESTNAADDHVFHGNVLRVQDCVLAVEVKMSTDTMSQC